MYICIISETPPLTYTHVRNLHTWQKLTAPYWSLEDKQRWLRKQLCSACFEHFLNDVARQSSHVASTSVCTHCQVKVVEMLHMCNSSALASWPWVSAWCCRNSCWRLLGALRVKWGRKETGRGEGWEWMSATHLLIIAWVEMRCVWGSIRWCEEWNDGGGQLEEDLSC